MRQTEIENCAGCGKGVMHSGCPMFYRIRLDTMCINPRAVQQQAGLEMMLGGNAAIANVMGGDPEIAEEISNTKILLCQDCGINDHGRLLSIIEQVNEDRAEEGQKHELRNV